MVVHAVSGKIEVHMGLSVRCYVTHTGGWGWEAHWTTLTAWLVRLRQVYAGAAIDSTVDLWGIVNSFMTDCWHMRDVLKNDEKIPITAEELDLVIAESRALQICRDYANTWKHVSREKYDVASIWQSGDGEVGFFVMIAYGPGTADPERDHEKIDALDLAEQGYAAWRAVLKRHGIEEPSGLIEPILARSPASDDSE